MAKETIDLGHGWVEVRKDGNLIYLDVHGEYTDDDVIVMTGYLEEFFAEIGGPTIRVWDSTNIAPDGFKLTAAGTDRFTAWQRGIGKKWPDNVAYLIGDNPLKYGISRMYEIKASGGGASINVVRGMDELPDDIRTRILRIK